MSKHRCQNGYEILDANSVQTIVILTVVSEESFNFFALQIFKPFCQKKEYKVLSFNSFPLEFRNILQIYSAHDISKLGADI
jgi:hypothetical protein